MAELVEHKHVIIRAELDTFFGKEEESKAVAWCRALVDSLGMNLLKGPTAVYVDREGLRGWTIACIIETSHIVIHVWDEPTPILAQFDVYTCGSLNLNTVFTFLSKFGISSIEYLLLDREFGLEQIDAGVIKGGV